MSPPTIPWYRTFAITRAFMDDALGYLDQAVATHGPVFSLPVADQRVWLVTDPDLVAHVLRDNAKNYTKGPLYDNLRPVLGEGLLTAEGEAWRQRRRLVTPAFHPRHLAGFAATTAAAAAATRDRWQPGQTLDMAHEMMELAFRIATRTLFGADLDADLVEIDRHFSAIARAATNRSRELIKLPLSVPTANNLRYRRGLAGVEGLVGALIARRRAEPAAITDRRQADLLGLLLAARDEETGQGLTDTQLRDEVLTFLFAGHETTATSLAWELYLLAGDPAAAARAQAEARALPGLPDMDSPMPFLRRVVDEGLRLYPPVWWLERTSIEADQLGPYTLPPKTRVALSPYVTHRLAAHWEQPTAFDPDRFLPERSAGRHRFAYFPFAGGPRVCIGQQFALITSAVALATLLQRWSFERVAERPIRLEPMVTIRSSTGVWLRLVQDGQPRRASA